MSDYTKALNGLRHCINLDGLEPNDTRIRCHGCPYFTEPTRCGGILMRDAAAAIEDLQAEVEKWTYNATLEQSKAIANFESYCKLKEQMPKRGEWILSKERMRPDMCSVCGCVYEADRFMDKIAWNYCPNCGAKMTGEQDVE